MGSAMSKTGIAERPKNALKIKSDLPVNEEDRSETYGQDVLRALAEKQIEGLDTVNKYNFAFVGNVGVGKSTLINSLRGIFRVTQREYAPVDESMCTTKLQGYPHPIFKHVILWDFPGGGTVNRPGNKYFFDEKMYGFDHIIIVTAERITELDIAVAKAAVFYGVAVDFVRSKADLDITKRIRYSKDTTADVCKKSLRKLISEDFVKQCKSAEMEFDRDIFVVSERGFEMSEDSEKTFEMDETELLLYVVDKNVKRRNM